MAGRFAFIFPGQGSQTPGMLAPLAQNHFIIKETFDEASHALGYDLWDLVQNNPDDRLNQTAYTQPALLTASIALWRLWELLKGPTPMLLAGHSLGEYAALVCAGSVQFSDGVKLVATRGRYMQEAMPTGLGAMAAVLGMSDDDVAGVCRQVAKDQIISPANYNSKGQVVVAGDDAAIERFITHAKRLGAKKVVKLKVSVPAHCALMQPAAARFKVNIADVSIKPPTIPVIHNVDVSSHSDPDEIREALVKQLTAPVRWVETIEKMASEGIEATVECGPGKVLTTLNKRIIPQLRGVVMKDSDTIKTAIDEMTRA